MKQELHFVTPKVFTQLANIYCTSFYGSVLWDLDSKGCDKLYKAWNVMIRMTHNLDRKTHRYFIETISGCLHPYTFLASRLLKFFQSLQESGRVVIAAMAKMNSKDLRTTLGRNLNSIARDCNRSKYEADLTSNEVKKLRKYRKPMNDDMWKVNMAMEMMDTEMVVPGFKKEELKDMIDYICVS